jgi:hypothetical protein
MQARPFGSNRNSFGNFLFYFENMFLIGLKGCLENLKNSETCLNCFEALLQKLLKKW